MGYNEIVDHTQSQNDQNAIASRFKRAASVECQLLQKCHVYDG